MELLPPVGDGARRTSPLTGLGGPREWTRVYSLFFVSHARAGRPAEGEGEVPHVMALVLPSVCRRIAPL